MKDYKRWTSKDLTETITVNDFETKYIECLHRLWELENKIEKGVLVEVETETATKEKLRELKKALEIKEETAREILTDLLGFCGSKQKFCIVDDEHKTLIDLDELWTKLNNLQEKYNIELEE